MSARPLTSRGWLLAASTATAAAICLLPAGAALATPGATGPAANISAPAETAAPVAPASLPSDTEAATAALAATPWVTTGAVDQNGAPVALDDPRAANFVGNAYFKSDGTYTMYHLDGTPKLRGHWDMRFVDGKLSRWITSENAAGEVQWQRIVEIVDLDSGFFTYRVVDPADASKWVDIVHEPTRVIEPGTEQAAVEAATAALAATPWETTGATDESGAPVALDDPRAANFVGNAYFKADGTFTMYALDDSPKMHGNWEMRVVDGKLSRWIQALNADGSVAFERTVEIVRLDSGFFTYRVPGANGAFVDIVHEPTDHAEPGTEEPGTEEPGNGNNGSNGNQGNGSNGSNGNQGNSSNGNNGSNGAGNGHTKTGNNGKHLGAKNMPERLAATGGEAHTAGLAGGIAALVGGASLLGADLVRRKIA